MSEPKPEVVTRALVQDVQLPADGGTLALVTLDNGHDHTKPNTFGLEGMAGLSAAVATLQQRAEAGEIVAVDATGEGKDAEFTFKGAPKVGELDIPLVEAGDGSAD